MRGWRCTAPDRRQEFYLRRLAFALLVGGAAHTLVCWLTLQWGFFRGGENAFWRLFAVIWGGPWPCSPSRRAAPTGACATRP